MISPRFVCVAIGLAVLNTGWAQFSASKNTAPKIQQAARSAFPSGPHLQLGPLLGHVTDTSAKIWVQASTQALVSVVVGHQADLSDRVGFKAESLVEETFFSGHVLVTNLEPATRYHYAVLVNGSLATMRPFPSFTTAPRASTSGRQRFAFVSCVGYNGFDSAAAWADMATRTNFDLLLMLGDNHYGDTTVPAKHLQMYGVQRRLPGYAEISRRVPQYAIWDNHDFAGDPPDKRARGKEDSLRAFKMLWPNPAYGEKDNPGVYFKFTRGDIEFFMLDGRYHRDANNAPEDGKKTHLGEKQLAWLKRELMASKAKIKVLATGGEWQTYSQAASWASFLRERNDIFKHIEENRITGVLLVSGDRHFTAAYQAAGKFIEVTSGPMGSRNVEPRPTPEMFWNAGRTGRFYCILDVNTAMERPQVTLEVYRASEGQIYRRVFTWDEVLGKAKIEPLTQIQRAAGVSTSAVIK